MLRMLGIVSILAGLFFLNPMDASVSGTHGRAACPIASLGDSITVPVLATSSYAQVIASTISWTVSNNGYSGDGWNYIYTTGGQTQNLNQLAPTVIDPLLSTTPPAGCAHWLMLFAGTNDIYLDGKTGAQTYAFFQTQIAARINAGWNSANILVLGMLPRENNSAERAPYNSLLSGGASTYGYTFVALENDANIGCDNCQNNTTYYNPDKIHPTQTGQEVIANLTCLAMNLPYTCPAY